jgi:hypothetical protein
MAVYVGQAALDTVTGTSCSQRDFEIIASM